MPGYIGYLVVFYVGSHRNELEFTKGEYRAAKSLAQEYAGRYGRGVLVGYKVIRAGHQGARVLAEFNRQAVRLAA